MDHRKLSRKQRRTYARPTMIIDRDDAWNYMMWYHVTTYPRRPDEQEFFEWWNEYRKADDAVKKQMENLLGEAKLSQWRAELTQYFEDAKKCWNKRKVE